MERCRLEPGKIGTSAPVLFSRFRSRFGKRLALLFALLIGFHGQPLGVPLHANGY